MTDTSLIILSNSAQIFDAHFIDHIGERVRVFSDIEAAISSLEARPCTDFITELRGLFNGWRTQRLIRTVREQPKFNSVRIWLTAEKWQNAEEAFVVGAGAHGVINNSPDYISSKFGIANVTRSISSADALDAIDSIFSRYAGPMKTLYVSQARQKLRTNGDSAKPTVYVNELINTLVLPARRIEFINAVKAAKLIPS